MANALTLTALTEVIFRARDVVAKEPTGYIQGCTVNSARDGVSINGTVQSFVTPAATVNNSATPAMTVPAPDAQTVAAKTMTIGQVARVAVPLNGEDRLKLQNTAGYEKWLQDTFAQSMRGIRNTIEAHCASIAQLGASRAYGTAGTNPFANKLIDAVPFVRQILVDNGAPMDDQLSLAVSTTSGTYIRTIPNLYKANEAGSEATLRRGEILNLSNLSIRETSQPVTTVAGTGANYVVNGATAVGATSIVLKTGTGTVVPGDVVTIGNYKYVVVTGVAAPGTIVIAEPGLRAAAADGDTVTLAAAYNCNTAFHRSAIELVMRPPALPAGGDIAIERMTVQDDIGLVYEIAMYKGYLMNSFEIVTYYQAKAWNSKYIATLMG